MKGATSPDLAAYLATSNFNPRSREGSDYYTERKNYKFEYFNPRSREGSDVDENGTAYLYKISIHAPAKGATDISD